MEECAMPTFPNGITISKPGIVTCLSMAAVEVIAINITQNRNAWITAKVCRKGMQAKRSEGKTPKNIN
ncbi:unnamed protein product [Larinioides sclopetarius]|uniref:Uncharacterized protein n=2 Tax=Larinioides sclopetarius TaxID=280406 RepID=A0AAV2BSN3_9ARAC